MEYVAMPEGSSSAAPVISPGPNCEKKSRARLGARWRSGWWLGSGSKYLSGFAGCSPAPSTNDTSPQPYKLCLRRHIWRLKRLGNLKPMADTLPLHFGLLEIGWRPDREIWCYRGTAR